MIWPGVPGVVTSITSSGKDSSALSAPTTTYSYYHLAQTGNYVSGAWCHPDQYQGGENQCVGDNWLVRQTGVEEDWQDYYHAEYRGFDQVWQVSPAGDLTVGYYFSTEGWNKPATDPADYDAGQMFQQEIYQGGSFDPNKLLSRTVNTYPTLSNPMACYTPTGSSPYAACDVMILGSKTTEFDETNSSNSPWVEHDYTYDDYDTTHGLKAGYHNLTQEVISGANLSGSVYPLTRKWSYAINDSGAGGSGWIYYNVDHVSHSSWTTPSAISGSASTPAMTKAMAIPDQAQVCPPPSTPTPAATAPIRPLLL